MGGDRGGLPYTGLFMSNGTLYFSNKIKTINPIIIREAPMYMPTNRSPALHYGFPMDTWVRHIKTNMINESTASSNNVEFCLNHPTELIGWL